MNTNAMSIPGKVVTGKFWIRGDGTAVPYNPQLDPANRSKNPNQKGLRRNNNNNPPITNNRRFAQNANPGRTAVQGHSVGFNPSNSLFDTGAGVDLHYNGSRKATISNSEKTTLILSLLMQSGNVKDKNFDAETALCTSKILDFLVNRPKDGLPKITNMQKELHSIHEAVNKALADFVPSTTSTTDENNSA
jgi:hypothetical protein